MFFVVDPRVRVSSYMVQFGILFLGRLKRLIVPLLLGNWCLCSVDNWVQ